MGIFSSDEEPSWSDVYNLQTNKVMLELKIDKLEAENARLKEELATYGATGVCEVCSDKANKLADKYLGCLQEIKAIVCGDYEIVDPQGRKDILKLITKAESEG